MVDFQQEDAGGTVRNAVVENQLHRCREGGRMQRIRSVPSGRGGEPESPSAGNTPGGGNDDRQ